MSRFGNLVVVSDLNRLKLREQNNLRCYFVGGKIVKIDKDTSEQDFRYTKRVAFVLGRSVNPKITIEELMIYSRIYVNKLWSHKVTDDETGKKVTTPYYGADEQRYEKIKKLDKWVVSL